jgi:hypothetical protein
MSLLGLNSIVPAGLTAVAAHAAGKLADGLSFAETLLRGGADSQPSATLAGVAADEADAAAQGEIQARLDEFRKLLHQRLEGSGIDLSSPISLEDDGFGGIECDGGHPDRALIEHILAGDAELTAAFQALVAEYARSQTAAAGDAAAPFDGDERAPYERLLDDLDRRAFRLTLHGEQATIDE